MFTGIIEKIGKIKHITASSSGQKISILAPDIASEINIDDSVAVNGICLTVTSKDVDSLTVDTVRETVDCSTCRYWKAGRAVHLERGLLATDRLDGHIVQGHIDGRATLISSKKVGDGAEMTFVCESTMSDMMVEKGSIAIDGVSLTLTSVTDQKFSIAVIPFTLNNTLLGKIKAGNEVNIETDILGKYIKKFMIKNETINKDKLRTWGYTL